MIPGFESLVEERIKKAQKEGFFDNLEGANKPLKFDDQNVPKDLRLAHKILKNAGFLPPEVELKKKISNTEQLLKNSDTGSAEYRKIQKKLNYLLTKMSTLRGDIPCNPAALDQYRSSIIKKMS